MTGSLDVDAELFTPASERLARQTPAEGIAARHTPSAGLAVGEAHAEECSDTEPEPAPVAVRSADGAYPRRRDLRRQGGLVATKPAVKAPGASPAPAGLAFMSASSELSSGTGEGSPLGPPLPRRRDLRNKPVPVPAERTPENDENELGPSDEQAGVQRNGTIAVGVARAAVMTMLVGLGYTVVSSHQVRLDDSSNDHTATGDATAAMLAAQGVRGGEETQRAQAKNHVGKSEWDVHDELAQLKAANDKQTQARIAAAEVAAERVRVAKQAAAARAARREAAVEAAIQDAQRDPKALARIMAADRGWGDTQFTCLDLLWTKESNWKYTARNPSSGAYGIPQALPGSKMASAGSDWRTNPKTQIEWGLDYIADRYGTPCGAWSHSKSTGWY